MSEFDCLHISVFEDSLVLVRAYIYTQGVSFCMMLPEFDIECKCQNSTCIVST